MKNQKKIFPVYLLALAIIFDTMPFCNKKFDEPPTYIFPGISANTTIRSLKALHKTGGYEQITADIIVSGIVVGDDKSGNLYKEICIQDSSAGITVKLDGSGLYADYPVGRQVFIKCKGLWLSDYGRLVQLGMIDNSTPSNPQLTGIPTAVFNTYIIKGTLGNTVVPKLIGLDQLNDSLQSMLIQFNNVQFAAADTNKAYADTSSAKASISLTLNNCSNNKAIVYSSGYANFAGLKPPKGNGALTCVYFVYNATPELIIRDTGDVQLKGPRCGSSLIDIATLRSLYKGQGIKLSSYQIAGIIISDAANKNVSTGTAVLQNGNAGISVYFGGAVNYNLGDSIVLDISGDSLISYQGSLEIKTPPGAVQPAAISTGKTVVPQQMTISQLGANLSTAEYTLVTIINATATPAGTYSGNKTLTDASGNMTLYTVPGATFATQSLPAADAAWSGYANNFGSTKQFQVRSLTDVIPTVISTPTPTGNVITLVSSPYIIAFDDINNGLPAGVFVKLSSSLTSLGTDGTITTSKASWNASGVGFKNFASATGLSSAADQTSQDHSTNRALGLRQTSATGYDPGAAFVFLLNNTSGKNNLKLDFLLQSLDNTVGRTVVWGIDYAIGDNPSVFMPVTAAGTLNTGGTFSNNPISVNFGNALDNKTGKVWIRIVTLAASTGSSSRPSTAIDDVKISWN